MPLNLTWREPSALLLAGACLLGARAYAEEAGNSAAGELPISEVVVTATKRSEKLLDIPASISAIGSDQLSERGAVSMEDYLRTIPGVSYIDRGVANNSVVIRGLTADAQNYTDMGGTVGLYLGDIPLSGLAVSNNNADIKLIDMQRVEVLRGPQGTLFGDGSLGGAVRNIPVAPNLERWEGKAEIGLSETGDYGGFNRNVQAVANLPVIDGELALRVVGYHYFSSGFINNVGASTPSFKSNYTAQGFGDLVVDQDHIGDATYDGGRATALWKPTENFHASLMFLTQNLEQDGLPEVQLGLQSPYDQTRLLIPEAYGGGMERLRDRVNVSNLELSYDLPWANLLSSSSYVQEKGVLYRDVGANFGAVPTPQYVNLNSREVVEEARLTSKLDGPFQFLGGVYYNETVKNRWSDTYMLSTPMRTLDARFRVASVKQKAAFGEVSYTFFEKLKLTGGAREFKYDQDFLLTNYISPPTVISDLPNKGKSGHTYKGNIEYKFAPDKMVYAQYAQGFRLGNPVAGPSPAVCDLDGDGLIDGTTLTVHDRALTSDSLDSYELGLKTALPQQRLTLSAAVYRNNWTGIPVTIVVPCGFGQTYNAGQARTQGGEAELTWMPLDRLALALGGSYLDAHLTADAPGIGAMAGDRLPGSPRYNVNASARYDLAIATRPAFVRFDYLRSGGFYNNLHSTGVEIGDYGLLNARGGISFGSTAIELYVNNVTNTDALTWMDSVMMDLRGSRVRPRTVGMTARFAF